ncbi:two component transcriptional regulator, LytTR family [Ignavigranum ruoffiae]|uniref:Two component transcriptional regulator, LytTR family n=1 Tax=Ignavigranum ruoffiae TaxID=89093 RepID=A0A1H9GQ45_9LACT|nr:LytTR family DNA-binding domain-containing protein [Ignavigranum ruoffiae]SEQ52216.1 two component transcriptional regulator, LytTR family [Ignavigranum ruoffiae]
MLNIFVMEDQAIENQGLSNFISHYLEEQGIAGQIVFSGYQDYDLLSQLHSFTGQRTLFFLDVDLGQEQLNGIQLGAEIRRQLPLARIVFVTTHEEMALLTFKYSVEALDYIIKDQAENFYQRVAYCINLVAENEQGFTDSRQEDSFILKLGDQVRIFDRADILCLEKVKLSRQVVLTTLTGQLQFAGTLNELAVELPTFIRIHRGCLINPQHIQSISKEGHSVTLTGGYTCPIARRKVKELVKQMDGLIDEPSS